MIDTDGEVRIECTLMWEARRFVCFVLTLEDVISREVHNKMCSRMLDYERQGS